MQTRRRIHPEAARRQCRPNAHSSTFAAFVKQPDFILRFLLSGCGENGE